MLRVPRTVTGGNPWPAFTEEYAVKICPPLLPHFVPAIFQTQSASPGMPVTASHIRRSGGRSCTIEGLENLAAGAAECVFVVGLSRGSMLK